MCDKDPEKPQEDKNYNKASQGTKSYSISPLKHNLEMEKIRLEKRLDQIHIVLVNLHQYPGLEEMLKVQEILHQLGYSKRDLL